MGWVKGPSDKKPSTTSGRFYPFKGLLLCGACQFNLTAYTKPKTLAGGTMAEYQYYTCTKNNKKLVCKESQLGSMELKQEIKTSLSDYEITDAGAKECKAGIQRLFDSHIKKQNQYKPLWLLDQQNARTALDTLDEKLEVGNITDKRYRARAEKHEDTLVRTKRLLEGSSTDAKA